MKYCTVYDTHISTLSSKSTVCQPPSLPIPTENNEVLSPESDNKSLQIEETSGVEGDKEEAIENEKHDENDGDGNQDDKPPIDKEDNDSAKSLDSKNKEQKTPEKDTDNKIPKRGIKVRRNKNYRRY